MLVGRVFVKMNSFYSGVGGAVALGCGIVRSLSKDALVVCVPACDFTILQFGMFGWWVVRAWGVGLLIGALCRSVRSFTLVYRSLLGVLFDQSKAGGLLTV